MEPHTKTWGPFNGRQLTTIICVTAVAVLFPVGAWAATASNVSILDPGGVNKAKVDPIGQLEVGDGSGPLTVDGTVSARPVLPAKPITITQTLLQGTTPLYGPVSKAFGITSLTLMNNCPSEQNFTLDAVTTPGGTFHVQAINVASAQSLQLTFPSPLVVAPPAGSTAELQAEGSAFCIYVTGVGIQS